jgi:biotin carboxylase
MTLPRVGVVLDFGAATPLGILAAARGLCEVVFLGDRSLPYVARTAGELAGLAEVRDLGRFDALRLDGVTTFSEAQIRRTAELAAGGGFAYLRPSVAAAVTDKYLQRRMLASAGLPVPRCRVVGGPGDLAGAVRAVGLPAVLKPRRGAGSAHTCRVDSLAEADRRLREPGAAAGPFVLEEYLVGDSSVAGPRFGDYVSVESVLVGGTLRHVEVTGKFPLAPPFRETGYVVPSTLAEGDRRAVLEAAGAALRALGVTDGVTHVEVKLTPDGPRVIEVNGRLGGYVADLVRQARRVDLIRLALAAAIGRDLEVPAPAYRRHAFQYFLTAPMEATVLRGLDGVGELARQRGIGHVEVFRRAGDRLDWRRGTLDYLGIVHGWAADHDGVLGLIDTTVRLLSIDVG